MSAAQVTSSNPSPAEPVPASFQSEAALVSGASPAAPAGVMKQPAGLYLLFTSEMWERMSYYGMRALLVIYMTRATTAGGFGWSKESALSIYGWYTGLVYLTPLIGGAIADRYIGQRKSVIIGGALMMCGHFMMAVPGVEAFFGALSLLILGNGMFKPNISTMVGGLFEQGDPRRDGAFTIFYMGINVGALLASLVCGTLGEKIGFHYGFGSAGVGMALGLVVYVIGAPRLLGTIGLYPSKKPGTTASGQPAVAEDPLTPAERDRITVILILAVFVIFFWAAFEQAGGLMTLYTDEKVDRHLFGWEMPTSWFQMFNPGFILMLAPLASMLWTRLGKIGKDPSTPVKMAIGLMFLGVGFAFMMGAAAQSGAGIKANLFWIVAAYFFHTVGELCLSPIGLSMVTKLAPKRLAAMLMGVWFLANAIANKLSAMIGSYSERLGEFQLFSSIVVGTVAAGLVLLASSRKLTSMMHGRG